MPDRYISNKQAALLPPYPVNRSSHLQPAVSCTSQIRANRRNAPTADVFSNYNVWFVCGLILCHFVNLSRLGGIKPTIVGTVVTSSKRCVERSNPIRAHQVQEGLSRLLNMGQRSEENSDGPYMLILWKGVLVLAFCLLHILESRQHERSAAFSNAPRYAIFPVAQEGTHGRAPVSTHGKVDVEQQHVRGAGEQAREIAP